MKNREWLSSQNEYDLLCEINSRLLGFRCDCFIDAMECDMPERCKKFRQECSDCIQSWLNEERR